MAHRKGNVRSTWDADLAYVIGVIATDGNLSPDLRHLHITSKDYEMVVNCRKCLNIKNKIGKKARGGSQDKKYYVLQFGDKNFFEFLLKLGLTPRKSKTISKLKIPNEHFLHFLRGCIDGDGSISIWRHPESKYQQCTLRLCSASEAFLEWILKSCRKLFFIEGGTILHFKNSSVYTLRFGTEDSINILKMIYPKNVVCLSRKKKYALKVLMPGWRN